jgi:glycine cleavage system regulatory protein
LATQKLVIGFIGKDEPGLVRRLAQIVSDHNGSWLESRMSQLANRFAGIAVVSADADKQAELKLALESLGEVSSVVEEAEDTEIKNARVLEVNVVGPDRPGIVHEVTLALEQNVANVMQMETRISAAPMSGEITFSADATVEVDFAEEWQSLADKLDAVALQLGIDILVEEEPDQ